MRDRTGPARSGRPVSMERTPAAAWLAVVLLLLAPTGAWAAGEREDGGGALGLLLLLPVALLSAAALQLLLWTLAPGPLLATARLIERWRGRCLVVGLVAVLLGLGLTSWLGQYKGAGELAGALLLGMLALGALMGATAVTALMGRAVMEMWGKVPSRAGSVVAGALLLGLAGLFPLVGQVLSIYFLLVGLGGALLALMQSAGRSE